MIETFKLLNGVYNLSEDLMFMPIETRISNTRGHNFKLIKTKWNLSIRKHAFTVRTVNAWNSLPKEVANSQSLN